MTPDTLVTLFDRAVAAHPDSPAVSDSDRRLTYAELSRCADMLAAELAVTGVGREDRVAVYMPRGVAVIAAVLGVLRAGAAYVPVDVGYPAARRDQMMTGGDVRLIICAPGHALHLRHLDRPVFEWAAAVPAESPDVPGDVPLPPNTACVLFTSGSTGQPKGVVLEHRQMAQFALDPALPALTPGERMAQAASVSFDTFTFEVWRAVAGGAEIVVLPSIPDLMNTDLQRELRSHRITAMLAPAIALNHVVRHDRAAFASMRLLCSGGDVLLADTCRDLRSGGYARDLFNLYGPTEVTVACTGFRVEDLAGDVDRVPIGRPFDGARLYVLDDRLRPVADGEPGELYISGAGVGRGYLGQPGLTAARFLADPFAGDGSRMYRTGDRVRRDTATGLEFLGRVDSQVKVRGYRVEPQEVERWLCRHPQVREAAVMAVGDGEKRLVGCVVAEREQLRLRDVREFLAERVPDYLIPAELLVLQVMPTDAHGKRDWTALGQRIGDEARRRAAYEAPRTENERYLARLWEDLLGVELVGVHDDFFALGGHSLLAARTRLLLNRDLWLSLPPEVVFENSEVATLARILDEARESEDAR